MKYVSLPYGAGSINGDQAQELHALIDEYDRERYSSPSHPWLTVAKYDRWSLYAWPSGGYTAVRNSWEPGRRLVAKTFEDLLTTIRNYYEEEK